MHLRSFFLQIFISFLVPSFQDEANICDDDDDDDDEDDDDSHGQYVAVGEETFPPGAAVHHVREVTDWEQIIVIAAVLITIINIKMMLMMVIMVMIMMIMIMMAVMRC